MRILCLRSESTGFLRAGSEKVNKCRAFLAFIAFLFLTSIGLTRMSAEEVGVWGKTYKLGTLNKTEVKNLQGEKIGEIVDFIIDAKSGRIAFVIFSHIGMTGMGQKVKIIPFAFLFFDETEKIFLLNATREDLAGEVVVKNLQGEELGRIEDFVVNSQGLVPFVVLSYKEKSVIVPYGALSVDPSGNFFMLDASIEKLASAPPFEGESISLSQAEEIYRYFGQRPYWKLDEAHPPTLPQTIPLPEF